MTNSNSPFGTSIFMIATYAILISVLLYFLIWSYNANSLRGIVLSIIFILFAFTAPIFNVRLFSQGSWVQHSIGFTLGFGLWAFLSSFTPTQSVLSISTSFLYSTIVAELPLLVDFITTAFLIPIAEEMFWMISIPIVVITLMTLASEKFKFMKNKLFQLATVIFVAGSTFAYYHVGNQGILTFLIAAFIFRAIMVLVVYGDQSFDFIKGLDMMVSFGIGAHIANNWMNYGFSKGLDILFANPFALFVVAAFMLPLFITAILNIKQVLLAIRESI